MEQERELYDTLRKCNTNITMQMRKAFVLHQIGEGDYETVRRLEEAQYNVWTKIDALVVRLRGSK